MSRKFQIVLCSAVFAFMMAALPIRGYASQQSERTAMLTARIQQHNDMHEPAAATIDNRIVVAPGPNFEAALFLTFQKDMHFALERMIGVLDRYSGSGFPAHCDEFLGYYLIIDSLLFELLFFDLPTDWTDIAVLVVDAGGSAVTKSDAVVQLCANGGRGSLSAHNHSATRMALSASMEQLRGTIGATEERGAISAESILAEIINDPITGADIDKLWRQGGDIVFSSTDLYLDMLLSEQILQELGGVYDRLLAGGSAECEDLLILLDLLSEPIIFEHVPNQWEDVYNGHLDSLLTGLDTSNAMAGLCISGAVSADAAQVQNGRHGISLAIQQLRTWLSAAEDRIDASDWL